jgi:hypothetical protein
MIFEKIRGFLASYLRRELAGFETYHDDAGALI